jgi:hypothetical protein
MLFLSVRYRLQLAVILETRSGPGIFGIVFFTESNDIFSVSSSRRSLADAMARQAGN